jgi:purine-binding chemotaxis protein CheW
MADLVRRRRDLMSRRAAGNDRGPRTEYLAFCLAGDVYAAPVALIRAIREPPPLTPVPRAPAAIMGIVSVRGQLVTVIDLRRRLRLVEAPFSRRARILLADTEEGETVGLYVDEVLQVYRLAESEIEPAMALGGDVAGYIAGIARPAGMGASPLRGGDIKPAEQKSGGPDASVVILLDLRTVLAFL